MSSWFTIMSVWSLKDKTSLVRLKEKQLSVMEMVQTDRKPLCLGENSVMGDVFKPRDPGGASDNPVICPVNGSGTSGRGVGLYRRTRGAFEWRTLLLCYREGRGHTLEMELLLWRLVQGLHQDRNVEMEAGFALSIRHA